jgi:hypothetical protein
MEKGIVTLREEEAPVAVEVTEESMRAEGFLEEEIASAKQHNIIKRKSPDGDNERKPVDASAKDTKQGDDSKLENKPNNASKASEIKIEDLDSFEKVHDIFEKTPDKFRTLPAHVRALYHNSKGLYKKAKVEEQKRVDLEKKFEYDSLKNKVAETKLDKVRNALKKENLTVEELEALIDGVDAAKSTAQAEKEEEQKELQEKQQKHISFVQARISEADKLGRAEHENFDDIVALAQKVIAEKPRQQKLLQDALNDESTSEKELVDLVVDIARLHSDFGKQSENPVKAEPTDEKVDRMVKNSQRKTTSASVSGGNGSRTKTYDELTAEDVARMSLDEYKKLPDAVRRRLKEEIE